MTYNLLAAPLPATHFCFVKKNPPEACLQAGFDGSPILVTEQKTALKIW